MFFVYLLGKLCRINIIYEKTLHRTNENRELVDFAFRYFILFIDPSYSTKLNFLTEKLQLHFTIS